MGKVFSKKIKTTTNKNRKFGLIVLTLSLFVVAVLVFGVMTRVANQQVDIVAAKAGEGNRLAGKTLLTEDTVQPKPVLKENLTDKMIKWEDRDKYLNKLYLDIPVRDGDPIYTDIISKERLVPGQWLEQIKDGNVAITVPYSYQAAGGKLLMPGDRIIYSSGIEDPNTKEVNVQVLLDNVVVKDMLNKEGESIYDKYRELALLDEASKEKLQKSEDFREFITPISLMVEVPKPQYINYAKFNFESKVKPTIGILQRVQLDNEQLVIYSTIKQFLDIDAAAPTN